MPLPPERSLVVVPSHNSAMFTAGRMDVVPNSFKRNRTEFTLENKDDFIKFWWPGLGIGHLRAWRFHRITICSGVRLDNREYESLKMMAMPECIWLEF